MSEDGSPRAGLKVAGRYQLGKLLGDGRTGQVFRARDLKSSDRVAVKLLHKPLCSVPEQVRRFAREFDATSRIDHPNVVRSLAFGQETDGPLEGTHYLVMELIDGRRLNDVLAGGTLDADGRCSGCFASISITRASSQVERPGIRVAGDGGTAITWSCITDRVRPTNGGLPVSIA